MATEFTLDPRAPLDDLEPLRELIGAARVVAVGESAHYVREYHHVRHRLARFLVERMGFTSLAMESGFSEGLAVDRWIHGGEGDPAEVAEHGLTYRFGRCAEMRGLLDWMRTVNSAGGRLAYTGLDLPGDLASMLPPLDGVGAYLARVDPEAADLLARARRQAEKYAGPYTIPAFAAYREMSDADRAELTVAAEGSVEALLRADRTGPQIADLRPLRADGTGPQRIRLLESYLDQPVAEAFDLVATVPATDVTEQAAG